MYMYVYITKREGEERAQKWELRKKKGRDRKGTEEGIKNTQINPKYNLKVP